MRLLLCCLAAFAATGCATVVSGSRQEIAIDSTPSGAGVFLGRERIGETPFRGEIRKKSSIQVCYEFHGAVETREIRPSVDPWLLGNVLLITTVPAGLTDFVTGAVWQYREGSYHVDFTGGGSAVHRYCLANWAKLKQEVAQKGGECCTELALIAGVEVEDALKAVRLAADDAQRGPLEAAIGLRPRTP